MMFHSRFKRNGKRRSLKKKRYDQSEETKTLINWPHFCAGILISYNRLLGITQDLTNRILHQYKRDRLFIPCNLKKNIFTIIAKDNIDHNARSTTATKQYHGTSFSVFQFPSVAFLGDMISYPDELPTATKSSNAKKVGSLPSYT